MSFGRVILLVLAVVLLATQYSFASYSGSKDDWTVPYYGNQQTFCIEKPKPTCIAEGGDCSIPRSVCCSGMKCTQEFWPLGERCRGEEPNYNMVRINRLKL